MPSPRYFLDHVVPFIAYQHKGEATARSLYGSTRETESGMGLLASKLLPGARKLGCKAVGGEV